MRTHPGNESPFHVYNSFISSNGGHGALVKIRERFERFLSNEILNIFSKQPSLLLRGGCHLRVAIREMFVPFHQGHIANGEYIVITFHAAKAIYQQAGFPC